MVKRKKGGGTAWKRSKKQKDDTWRGDGELVRENSMFEEYYRIQRMMSDEEFDQLMSCLVITVLPYYSRKQISLQRFELICLIRTVKL